MRTITLTFMMLVTISTTIALSARSSLAQSTAVNVIDAGLKPNDPNFDNTPKFNALLDNIGVVSRIYFPTGAYYFNSRPKRIMKNLVMFGDGINSTSLIRNYNAINYNEALIYSLRTLNIEKMAILAGAGTKHGSAIRLDGMLASGSVLRDLYITTLSSPGHPGGTFDIPLMLSSNDSLGIRSCRIDNVELFAATIHLAWFVNVQGLTANLNAYPAGGEVSHITIQGSEAIQMVTRHLVRLWVYTSNNITLIRNSSPVEIIVDKASKNIRQL